jgi:branched-chain amino acid aminotransferase
MHRFILHNDRILDAAEPCLSAGQVGLLAGWGVFSTLKVVHGVLFAFERHWARMVRDAHLMRVPFPESQERVHELLLKLVEANQAFCSTMRVIVVRNRGGMWQGPDSGRDWDLIALTADLKQWGESVKLAYQPQARHSGNMFSGAKILSWSMNLTWVETAQEKGFDEVILLNQRDEVAECTSANIFAAKGSRVWTPPLSSGCLPGVTRELLLHEVQVPGIELTERTLTPADLESADEVFISSTTRDLLPASAIGDHSIRATGRTLLPLRVALGEYTQNYIVARPKAAKI